MAKEVKKLLTWYKKNYRDFPWRKTKDPYKIWLSEVMLQQTRAQAVLSYYKDFLKKFPKIENLAKAKESQVLEAWSGLGYYSRARNLHKAAKILSKEGFPEKHQELLKIPGFGDYTARAVASFAFSDTCAVLDGNVIRFLTRYYALPMEWWKGKERKRLQALADKWVENQPSAEVNQALIEMGATICTASSPACLLCPLKDHCKAFALGKTEDYPLKKQKRLEEIWYLQMHINYQDKKIAMQKNQSLPFLKNQFLCPVKGKRQKTKPKDYSFQHSITHHKIYVKVVTRPIKTSKNKKAELKWVSVNDVKKVSPFSLTTKAIDYVKKSSTT